MKSRALPACLFAAALALGACRAVSPLAASVDRVPLPTPRHRTAPQGHHLTVFPTPREAAYEDSMVSRADALRVDESSPGFLDTLKRQRLDATWRGLPPEGYVLRVTAEHGRPLVILAAADVAGRGMAERALDQLTVHTADGRTLVRECLVVDAPAFRFRGSKRPRGWERRYGANFAWGTRDGDLEGRFTVPFYAPGSPFDATDEGVERALAALRPWQRRGARAFAIKFDDVGFALTARSRVAFGSYPRALVVFLHKVRAGLAAQDPDVGVYFLPQTYWWSDPRLVPFARALRVAGGLDSDVGLVMTGPEIVSERIGAIGLRGARAAFGLTERRALLYDNLGREGDWGPLTGREAMLTLEADGVFGERGTPVHRLTRLDWSWNPFAYDAEASWERAIYELAGPAGFDALAGACRAFRERLSRSEAAAAVERFARTDLREWDTPVPQAELVEVLTADLVHLDPVPPAGRTASER